MEHHSNIVPWQLLCERSGAVLRVAPINDAGELLLDEFLALLGPAHPPGCGHSRIQCAGHHQSRSREIVAAAHARGVPVLLDGAQAIAHQPVDVRALGCDFYAFSGHKLCGPTGIGVLYGREALLADLPPFQGGGDMILTVSFSGTTYNDLPYRLEAGTPHDRRRRSASAQPSATSPASGWHSISACEADSWTTPPALLLNIPGLAIVGTARHKASLVSFNIAGIHPHDLGTVLDQRGVAIRAGHHCAMPVMERFGMPARRAPHSPSTTPAAEIDQLVEACALPADVRLMSATATRPGRPVPADRARSQPATRGTTAGRDRFDREAEGHNPLCGDKIRVYLRIGDDALAGRRLRGVRLRDLPGLRVADD